MATPILIVDEIVVGEGPNAIATFVLRLSQPSATAASLGFFLVGGSASIFGDFTGLTGTVTFAAGETVKTISVSILDDLAAEVAESFLLRLHSAQNLTFARSSVLATIIDNDKVGPTPLASVNDGFANESDGNARFTISLDRASTTAITVTYQTVAASALAGSDYVGVTSSVTFAPGEVVKTVAVQLLDDGVAEGDERFGILLTGVTGGASLASAQGTAIIEHNDGVTALSPTLSVADIVVSEGPNAFATFVLSLSQPSAAVTSVIYSLSSAQTTSNGDFFDTSDTVLFAPGETVKVVNIAIIDDTSVERAETFFLRLGSELGLTLARGAVTATIVDNDTTGPAPFVSVSDAIVNESDGDAHFTVTLDRASTTPTTVSYQTVNASALAGSDYVGATSTLVLLPGETAKTVAVQLIDDGVAEIEERFGIQLTGVAGGAVLADAQGTAIIEHNDGAVSAQPVLSVDDIVVSEGSLAKFVLRLDRPSAAATSVTVIFANGTASAFIDFMGASDVIRFAAGETVKVVSIPTFDDSIVEQAGSFYLRLGIEQGLTLGRASALATIIDNDTIGAAPRASVSDTIVNESDGDTYFSITLDRASATAITVNYQTVDASALSGSDYLGATSSVIFLAGETAKTVAVQLIDDGAAEADEKFGFQLTGATGGAVLADAQGTAFIEHNDGALTALPILNVDDIVVGEGPSSFATFVLRLSQPSANPATVSYSLTFSTATGVIDYVSMSDTIRFAAGETVKVITVPIIDDSAVEPSESMVLSLSSAQGLALGRASALGTIIDNDTIGPAPFVSVSDTIVNESDGHANFWITLDRASATAITVSYQTVDASALSGSDYLGVTSSATFLPGETAKTVAVQLVDDGVAELDERFSLQLSGATGGAVLVDALGAALIEHNDGAVSALPMLNVDDIVVSEGPNSFATFVLRLGQQSGNSAAVSYSLSGTSAGSSSDFVSRLETIRFAAGETVKVIRIPLIDDLVAERAESFYLTLGSQQGLTLSRTSAIATIIDNDTIGPAPLVSVSDDIVNESDGDAAFTITLDRASVTAITVSYQTVDATALSGSDYVGVTSTVTFLPGEVARTIAVQLINDGAAEPDEKFDFQLTGATGGAVLADAQGKATIERNDGVVAALPILNVEDIVVSEEDALATFVLRLSQLSAGETSVSYSQASATAFNFSDFWAVSDTIRFSAGETVKVISVPLLHDTTIEQVESFLLTFNSPQGLALGRTLALATIIDDDTTNAAPLVSVSNAFVNESDGDAHFAITLDRASTTAITVSYQTADGLALAGSDYVGVVSSVVFLPGEVAKTVAVQLIDDGIAEADEALGIQLTGTTGGAVLGDALGAAVIGRNDGVSAALPILSVDDVVTSEGSRSLATFVLRLSQPSAGTTSAVFSVATGTAGFPDLHSISGTVTFGAGETVRVVSIPIIDDGLAEASENFSLQLSSAQGLTFGRTSIPATIIDNDGPLLIAGIDALKLEGHAGSTALTFALTLKQPFGTNQTLNWSTTGVGFQSASASDFVGSVLPSGSVTFAAGETGKVITVNVAGDTTLEGNEFFILSVSDPSNALGIGTVQAQGTIVDDDAFAASITSTTAAATEASTGTTVFTFTVSLNRTAGLIQNVGWVVTGSGVRPANGADFVGGVLPSGTVTFAAGETSKTITVSVVGDTLVEASETFVVSVSSVTQGLVAGASTAIATILNDDSAIVSISPLLATRAEGHSVTTAFTFVVSLDRSATATETVNWAVSGAGANAAAASDFAGEVLPSGTVTFMEGETSKTITVNVAGDTVVETDETFTVTLSNASSALGIGTASASGTILNDEAAASISAVLAIKPEGNAGATSYTFTVTRSGDVSAAHTVSYAVSGSGANPASGADFVGGTLPVGTLGFEPGETAKSITVNVVGESVVEADEGFTVTLLNPAMGLALGTASASGTILNDDASVSVAALSAAKAEGNAGSTAYTFTVTQAGNTTQTHSVSYAVTASGLNPASGLDFAGGALPSGTVTFAPGETSRTITVEVVGDLSVEADETFTVALSNPSAGVSLGTATAIGTILADDASVSLAAALAVTAEGTAGTTAFTFTLTQSGDVSVTHIVSFAVSGSGASPVTGADFVGGVLPSGTVTFAPGETSKTITLNVAGNIVVEADETFTMTLSNPSAGLMLGTASATGTILNDDVSISIVPLAAVKAEGHIGVTAFTFTLTQAGDVSLPHTVSYAVSGTGTNPATATDFAGGVLASGTVTFAAGETSKTLTVDVQGDTGAEPDETFIVTLTTLTQVNLVETTSNFMTIAATGQTLGISLTAPDLSSATSEAVHGLVSRFGGTGGGQYNIAFVIDRSGSTTSTFTGAQTIPDLNGDGQANTILDAEIAGYEALLASINDLGLANANVALISFESGAVMDIKTTAGADANKNGTLDIVEALHALKGGNSTNYEAGLQIAETFFNGSPGGQNVLYFLSDGFPDSQAAYADEVSRLLAAKTDIRAFGVGSGASQPALDLVDDGLANKSAAIILDPSQLSAGLQGGGVTLAEIARVELLVNGQVVQTILPGQLKQTPLGLQYDSTLTGLSTTQSEQISARVVATDAVATTVTTSQVLAILGGTIDLGLDPTATGTILNDDAVISLAAAEAVKSEGQGGTMAFTFTATRTGDVSVSHGVSYAVMGTGANPANASDFSGGVLPAGTVTFAVGETSKTITVDVVGDVVAEADELFTVTLTGPTSGAILGTRTASGTILNDEASLSVAALAAAKAEGQGGTTAFTFTVTRTGDASVSHSVSYAVTGLGANAASASDFVAGVLPSGTVTFAAGETNKTISIAVSGDAVVELDEGFAVTLSNVSAGLLLGTASASGTIQNDDFSTVSIAVAAAAKAEGNSATTSFTFTVSLNQAGVASQTVAWGVTGSGATAADALDFAGGVLPAGTVTFAAGETTKTVTIGVAGDVFVEAAEGFTVTLSAPSSGLALGTASAIGTIQNDDVAAVVTAHGDAYIVHEGKVLTVALSAGLLANDLNASTASLLGGPAHGSLQLVGSGNFSYTPAPGFQGIDFFTYQAGNNGSSLGNEQAVVYVVPVNVGASTTLDLLALTAEEQIAATYVAFFGRAADAGGFGFWVNQFITGLPVQGSAALFANIASSFGVSTEAKALYPFLVDPFGASDGQISDFLDSVYQNLFNRGSDAGGLGYWTGQTKATLQAGQFVGSILVNIMSGAQDSAAGKDITTLMGKVAVSLDYVQEQQERGTVWAGASDTAAATNLLQTVTSDPLSVLVGIRNAENLIAAHA